MSISDKRKISWNGFMKPSQDSTKIFFLFHFLKLISIFQKTYDLSSQISFELIQNVFLELR